MSAAVATGCAWCRDTGHDEEGRMCPCLTCEACCIETRETRAASGEGLLILPGGMLRDAGSWVCDRCLDEHRAEESERKAEAGRESARQRMLTHAEQAPTHANGTHGTFATMVPRPPGEHARSRASARSGASEVNVDTWSSGHHLDALDRQEIRVRRAVCRLAAAARDAAGLVGADDPVCVELRARLRDARAELVKVRERRMRLLARMGERWAGR